MRRGRYGNAALRRANCTPMTYCLSSSPCSIRSGGSRPPGGAKTGSTRPSGTLLRDLLERYLRSGAGRGPDSPPRSRDRRRDRTWGGPLPRRRHPASDGKRGHPAVFPLVRIGGPDLIDGGVAAYAPDLSGGSTGRRSHLCSARSPRLRSGRPSPLGAGDGPRARST